MADNQRLILVAAAAAIVGLTSWPASAASPTYCALYAREYAIQAVQQVAAKGMRQSVEDQAYFRCLNQDDDPPLPRTSAYFDQDLRLTPLAAPPLPSVMAPPAVAMIANASPVLSDQLLIAPVPSAPGVDPAVTASLPTLRNGTDGDDAVSAPSWLRAGDDSSPAVAGPPSVAPMVPPRPKLAPITATGPLPAAASATTADTTVPKPSSATVITPAPKPTATTVATTAAPKPTATTMASKPNTTLVAAAGPDSGGAAPVYQGSGLAAGTPEWETWCAKYFPNSWDAKTGTVVHRSSTGGERVVCK
jgi:hypothetical protein